MSVKVCMTKEMVERAHVPVQQQGDCQTTMQTRTGNTMKLFINGTMEASDTLNNALRDTGTKLWLGQYGADRFYFNGSIDEFRVSKGIARWTADFTPYSVAYS